MDHAWDGQWALTACAWQIFGLRVDGTAALILNHQGCSPSPISVANVSQEEATVLKQKIDCDGCLSHGAQVGPGAGRCSVLHLRRLFPRGAGKRPSMPNGRGNALRSRTGWTGSPILTNGELHSADLRSHGVLPPIMFFRPILSWCIFY